MASHMHQVRTMFVAVTDCRTLSILTLNMDTMCKLNCINADDATTDDLYDDYSHCLIYFAIFAILNWHWAHYFCRTHPPIAGDRVFPMQIYRDLSVSIHVCSWRLWVWWPGASSRLWHQVILNRFHDSVPIFLIHSHGWRVTVAKCHMAEFPDGPIRRFAYGFDLVADDRWQIRHPIGWLRRIAETVTLKVEEKSTVNLL